MSAACPAAAARTATATPGAARCCADRVDSEARVAGWVHRRRDHGGLIFIDLRDRTGLVQLVFHPDDAGERLRARPQAARRGRAQRRRHGRPALRRRRSTPSCRPARSSSRSPRPSCSPTPRRRPSRSRASRGEVGEEARLRYRYLDLRREQMREALAAAPPGRPRRCASSSTARASSTIETPVLTRSTPGGRPRLPRPQPPPAGLLLRAAAVAAALQAAADGRRLRALLPDRPLLPRRGPARRPPARVHPARHRDVLRRRRGRDRGQRAAAGARLRARRRADGRAADAAASPTTRRWPASAPTGPTCASGSSWSTSPTPCARPSSRSSARCSTAAASSAASTPARRELPRSELDGLISDAQELGAKGLVWAFREGDGWRSPTAKFLTDGGARRAQRARSAPRRATCCCSSPTSPPVANAGPRPAAARPRRALGPDPGGTSTVLSGSSTGRCSSGTRRRSAGTPLHHPFTAPDGELRRRRPRRGRAPAPTTSSGTAGDRRRLDPYQRPRRPGAASSALLGIDAEEAEARFGFLLEALRYGAPPHGGIAYGLDRIVQRLAAGADSIRDVIAFPKTASGGDPLTGAPAPVDERQLRELGITVRSPAPQ